MTEHSREFVLRRKLEAAAPDPALAVAGLPPVEKALGLAMARVSDKLMELVVSAEETAQVTRSLAELLDEMPENALYAVLEGPAEAQGVMVLDNALMGALIEQQTAGALGKGAAPARKPTRTDAALCADWIDAVLGAVAETFAEAAQASWLSGFGFSCHLPDLRPLGLMLEDEPYRVLSFRLDLGAGARQGAGKLILPALGRAPEGRPVRADGSGESVPGPDAQRAWERRMEAQVMAAEVSLLAVLHRTHRTIGQVLAMAPGDVLTIPASVIGAMRLETCDGRAVARGRLGQSGGLRAIRLTDGAAEESDAAEDPLGAAMAMAEGVDALDGLGDLPAMDDAGALPDLPELPELDEDMLELPDLPGGGGAGLPDIDLPDIDDLTGT